VIGQPVAFVLQAVAEPVVEWLVAFGPAAIVAPLVERLVAFEPAAIAALVVAFGPAAIVALVVAPVQQAVAERPEVAPVALVVELAQA
jgi:hypothetical protein